MPNIDFNRTVNTPSGEPFTGEDGKPLTLAQVCFAALRAPPLAKQGQSPQPLSLDEVIWRDGIAHRIHAGETEVSVEDAGKLRALVAEVWSFANALLAGRAVGMLGE